MSYMKLKKLSAEAETDPAAAVALDNDQNRSESKKKFRPHFAGVGLAAAGSGVLLTKVGFFAPAAAEVINTTQIVEIITSMTDIFPSMGSMVIAIVPTLLILAVVGFLLGFFDSILDAINSCMKGFGR